MVYISSFVNLLENGRGNEQISINLLQCADSFLAHFELAL